MFIKITNFQLFQWKPSLSTFILKNINFFLLTNTNKNKFIQPDLQQVDWKSVEANTAIQHTTKMPPRGYGNQYIHTRKHQLSKKVKSAGNKNNIIFNLFWRASMPVSLGPGYSSRLERLSALSSRRPKTFYIIRFVISQFQPINPIFQADHVTVQPSTSFLPPAFIVWKSFTENINLLSAHSSDSIFLFKRDGCVFSSKYYVFSASSSSFLCFFFNFIFFIFTHFLYKTFDRFSVRVFGALRLIKCNALSIKKKWCYNLMSNLADAYRKETIIVLGSD